MHTHIYNAMSLSNFHKDLFNILYASGTGQIYRPAPQSPPYWSSFSGRKSPVNTLFFHLWR